MKSNLYLNIFEYRIIRVYFTNESIKRNIPHLIKCKEILNNHEIDCSWMDEETAQYETNYLCEFHPEKNDEYEFHGYYVYQLIDINLNRPKGATESIYHKKKKMKILKKKC